MMEHVLCGLAIVERQASSFPEQFIDYQIHHCAQVTDIPVGQIVFCLPLISSDVNWRAVVLNMWIEGVEHARLTWVHPGCLKPLGLINMQGTITVDLTEGRGNTGPSIDIGAAETGVRDVGDDLILDARWTTPFPRSTRDCTGHCFCLCHSMMTEPKCFAAILRFAAALQGRKTGRVCCAHAKHRSVAAANILRLCFGVDVNFSLATKDRTETCCRKRAADNVTSMLRALRCLPEISGNASRPLAHILELPE
jgi:hypothetical protein